MLAVDTLAAEEVDASMEEVETEDVQEEVDEVEEDTANEALEEASLHMKMKLTSQMSLVTLHLP